MTKIELTITPNYIPTWTYIDAIRELFQNALDQQAQNSANVASWVYNASNNTLAISNATSMLTAKSLLLGATTKADDRSTIGQFGEGYKIATLVLLREGKSITFYNYAAREIWRPRFVKSRRFGTDILTFFIETKHIWESVPSDDLTIVIEGISEEEYAEITKSNLHLRHDYKVVASTPYGDIIDLPGKIFVNGLFVCDYSRYKYGYNIKPEWIKLDRDRKMVSNFDLQWISSRMWSTCSKDANLASKVMDMVEAGEEDVFYLASMLNSLIWSDVAATRFKATHAKNAVPVKSQDDLNSLPADYVGVIVNKQYYDLIKDSSQFKMPKVDAKSPLDELQDLFDSIMHKLSTEEIDRFKRIMEVLKCQ